MDQSHETDRFSPSGMPGEETTSAARRRDISEHASGMAQDARAARESAADLIQAVNHSVAGWMTEKPYLGVAIAAGAGYVFGGGLGSRLTFFALRVGGRMLTSRFVGSLVHGASASGASGSQS